MEDSESYLFLTIAGVLVIFAVATFLYRQWKNAPPKWTVGTIVFTIVFILWSAKGGLSAVYWTALLLGVVYLPIAIVLIIVGLIQLSRQKRKLLTYGVILLVLALMLLAAGSMAKMRIPM